MQTQGATGKLCLIDTPLLYILNGSYIESATEVTEALLVHIVSDYYVGKC